MITLRSTIVILMLSTAISISACLNTGGPSDIGLTMETTSRMYRAVDTVHFFVLNNGNKQAALSSCNLLPTYFLQRFAGEMWHDQDSINIGPCLAIYGPVVIAPGQTVTGKLPLATRRLILAGEYRMRIEYRLSGEQNMLDLFSNSFQITS